MIVNIATYLKDHSGRSKRFSFNFMLIIFLKCLVHKNTLYKMKMLDSTAVLLSSISLMSLILKGTKKFYKASNCCSHAVLRAEALFYVFKDNILQILFCQQ